MTATSAEELTREAVIILKGGAAIIYFTVLRGVEEN